MQYLTATSIRLFHWQSVWLSLCSIMTNLSLQDELSSLIEWARKKRLHQVQRAYARRLHHLEERLWVYRMRNRGLVTLCKFLFTAYKQIVPAPAYYKKGSAVQYRLT